MFRMRSSASQGTPVPPAAHDSNNDTHSGVSNVPGAPPLRRFVPADVNLNPVTDHADATRALPVCPYHLLAPLLGSVVLGMGAATCNHWSMAWPFLVALITLPCGPRAFVSLGHPLLPQSWVRPILCWAAVVAPSAVSECRLAGLLSGAPNAHATATRPRSALPNDFPWPWQVPTVQSD